MLKKTMTFKDYNDEEVTEDFYFNLNKAELIELQVIKNDFAAYIKKLISEKDYETLLARFKQIILMAVGEKSPDGRRFIKNEQIRDNFVQTEAYSELLMSLATDAGNAAEFIKGIMPAGLSEELDEATAVETLSNDPAQDETPAWIAENREPTKDELKLMTPDQMRAAFARRLG